MDIALPRQLGIHGLQQIAPLFDTATEKITVVFAPQQWVYPSGTVGLSCLIRRAQSRGIELKFRIDDCQNVTYWERMGFFRNFAIDGAPTAGTHRDANSRFSEIRQVTDINDTDVLTEELVSVVAPDSEAASVYNHVVSEALNNVCQHSGENGFCASQYYDDGRVHFCIGDPGVGLRDALRRHGPADDKSAIELALQVGVTGADSSRQKLLPGHLRNRGVGLSAIQRLVTNNQGTLRVWTGDAMLTSVTSGPAYADVPYWTGTLVSAVMPRNEVTARFIDVMRDLRNELWAKERQAKA